MPAKGSAQQPGKVTTPWLPFPSQGMWFSLQEGVLCAALILPNGDRNGTLQTVDFGTLKGRERTELAEIARFLEEHAEKFAAVIEKAERAFWHLVASSYPETQADPDTASAAAVNLGVELKLAMIYTACDWVRHNIGGFKGAADDQPSLL